MIAIIIIAVIIFFVCVHRSTHKSVLPPAPYPRIDPDKVYSEDFLTTEIPEPFMIKYFRIAGAQHHTGKFDAGPFLGWTVPDPRNKHDHRAIAIVREDGRHLGFIARDDQEEYYALAEPGYSFPVVGQLLPYSNGDNKCYGGVAVFFSHDPASYIPAVTYFVTRRYQEDGDKVVPERMRPLKKRRK